jgi:hypothetical protein
MRASGALPNANQVTVAPPCGASLAIATASGGHNSIIGRSCETN